MEREEMTYWAKVPPKPRGLLGYGTGNRLDELGRWLWVRGRARI